MTADPHWSPGYLDSSVSPPAKPDTVAFRWLFVILALVSFAAFFTLLLVTA